MKRLRCSGIGSSRRNERVPTRRWVGKVAFYQVRSNNPKPLPEPFSEQLPAPSSEPVTKRATRQATRAKSVTTQAARTKPITRSATRAELATKEAARNKPVTRQATRAELATKQAAQTKPVTRRATRARPASEPATPPELTASSKQATKQTAQAKPVTRRATRATPAIEPATPPKPATKQAARAKPVTRRATRATPAIEPATPPELITSSKRAAKPVARAKPATRRATRATPASEASTPAEPTTSPKAATKPAAKAKSGKKNDKRKHGDLTCIRENVELIEPNLPKDNIKNKPSGTARLYGVHTKQAPVEASSRSESNIAGSEMLGFDYIFDITRHWEGCPLSAETFSETNDAQKMGEQLKPVKKTRAEQDTASKHTHLDYSQTPLSSLGEIFDTMMTKALGTHFEESYKRSLSKPLNIVTMCSGTEAPILATQMIRESLLRLGHSDFEFVHELSAEIEPYKAAFIARNFNPPAIIRDVTDFLYDDKLPRTVYNREVEPMYHANLLIAGSSCVDYSSLNHSVKEFGDKGESFSTMKGIAHYAMKYKPDAVILENVAGAPWPEIIEYWQGQVGYDVVAIKVDTKNFELPQTRQRGYLFGINQARAKKIGLDTIRSRAVWDDTMLDLQQRASAPYASFLIPRDTQEFQEKRMRLEKGLTVGNRSAGWAACKQRYDHLRSVMLLGHRRPFTKWQTNGSCTQPDYGFLTWFKKQRERIWDTLDIDYLRYMVERDYDMSFKTRSIDLSQNPDRDIDSKHWGIIGCITPSGMPFDTLRCGPIFGEEALALQGIPIDTILFKNETQKQLMDLAGNAMSTTVVGAAIVAAITAAYQPAENGNKDAVLFTPHEPKSDHDKPRLCNMLVEANEVPEAKALQKTWGKDGMKEISINLDAALGHELNEIQESASHARQMCLCEEFSGQTDAPISVCIDCGHTSCGHCRGNPPHNYVVFQTDKETRKQASVFISEIQRVLPRSLEFDLGRATSVMESFQPFSSRAVDLKERLKASSEEPEDKEERISTDSSEKTLPELQKFDTEYKDIVREAFSEPFRFDCVKRDKAWKIVFRSPHGRLELRFISTVKTSVEVEVPDALSEVHECYWLVFANDTKASSRVMRQILQTPVAKMVPKSNLLNGTWQLLDPTSRRGTVVVRGLGESVPSWESKLGLEDPVFKDRREFRKLALDFDAETSMKLGVNSEKSVIFELLPKCGAAQGSLHRGPTRSSDGSTLFYFLDPDPLVDAKEDSYVISTTHDRVTTFEPRRVLLKLKAGWRPIIDEESGQIKDATVETEYIDNWEDVSDMHLILPSGKDEIPALISWSAFDATSGAEVSCDEFSPLLRITLPLASDLTMTLPPGRVYSVNLAEQPKLLQCFAWALHNLELPESIRNWQDVPSSLLEQVCRTCVPILPAMSWMWTRNRGGKSKVIRPFHDAEGAADYEQAVKARPSAAMAFLYCYEKEVKIEVKINVLALVHRSVAYLREMTIAPQQTLSARTKIVAYEPMLPVPSWDIVHLQATEATENELILPSMFQRKLFRVQKDTVNWMLKRESSEAEWREVDVSDAPLPALGWNIIVETMCSVTIRGGVLGDEVGAGKTTTMLALTASSFPDPAPAPALGSSKPLEIENGRIKSAATLILVPENIIDQWVSQCHKCFTSESMSEPNRILIIIKTAKDLYELTLEDMTKPSIILVSWNLLDSKDYYEAFRRLCCAPNVPMSGGRPFEQWLSKAVANLESMLDKYVSSDDEEAFWAERENLKSDITNYQRFAAFRTRKDAKLNDNVTAPKVDFGNLDKQQNFPEALETFKEDDEKLDREYEEALEAWKGEPVIHPLLHLFCFDRVIVDEYTYLQGKSLIAMLQLAAIKRWIISATSPLSTFIGVNTMCRILGFKLSTAQVNAIQLGAGTKPSSFVHETSYTEDFMHFNSSTSVLKLRNQYEQGVEFLNHFVRRNPVVLAGTKAVVHYEVFEFHDLELATYLEFYVLLTTKSFNFTGKRILTGDPDSKTRARYAEVFIEQCGDGEEALICAASGMRSRNRKMIGEDLAPLTWDDLLTMKEKEFANNLQDLFKKLQLMIGYLNQNDDWEQIHAFASYVESIISGGSYGDPVICRLIDRTIAAAWLKPEDPEELLINAKLIQKRKAAEAKDEELDVEKDSAWVKLDDKDIKNRKRECNLRANELQSGTLSLAKLARSTRFYKAVSIVKSDTALACSKCGLPQPDNDEITILTICGHAVCNKCLHEQLSSEEGTEVCPHKGCTSTLNAQNQVSAARFSKTLALNLTNQGSRMTKIVDVLRNTVKIEQQNTNYVLIFVQFASLRDQLVEALTTEEILFEDAWSDATKATKQKGVAKFRKAAIRRLKKEDPATFGDEDVDENDEAAPNYKKGKQPRVLIMQLDSVDAAGWNLQCISHVFFVAPLLAPSQHSWDSAMAQAIGRSLRFGQKRKVIHVHHFVADKSIEVNVLAGRLEDFAGKVAEGVATRGSALNVLEEEDGGDDEEVAEEV